MANNIEWQPAQTRGPDRAKWPGRQFVFLVGERWHSDMKWARQGWGVLHVSGQTPHGYSEAAWDALCDQMDMEPESAQVVYWAPASVNWPEKQ